MSHPNTQTEAPREESKAKHTAGFPCCICGNVPALRKVGKLGFCKEHIAQATTTRASHLTFLHKQHLYVPQRKRKYDKAQKILKSICGDSPENRAKNARGGLR